MIKDDVVQVAVSGTILIEAVGGDKEWQTIASAALNKCNEAGKNYFFFK